MSDEFNIDLPVLRAVFMEWVNLKVLLAEVRSSRSQKKAVECYYALDGFYDYFRARGDAQDKTEKLLSDLEKMNFQDGQMGHIVAIMREIWHQMNMSIALKGWFKRLEQLGMIGAEAK